MTTRLRILAGLFFALGLSACDPSNVCGDPIATCRKQCGGDSSNGICYPNPICSGGSWLCGCQHCPEDLRGIDFAPADDLFRLHDFADPSKD